MLRQILLGTSGPFPLTRKEAQRLAAQKRREVRERERQREREKRERERAAQTTNHTYGAALATR